MGSNSINAARQAALAKVQSGEWSASQAYAADRSGAFSRGMFEPIEAAAKAGGIGQWAGASQAARQQAASFTPSQRQPSQATMRARAAGINPNGYDGRTDTSGGAVDNRMNAGWGAPSGAGMLIPRTGPTRSLQAVAPSAGRTREQVVAELNQLNDASIEFGGPVAERNMARISTLSSELNALDAASEAEKKRTSSLNSSATYRTASGGVVDPTLDQRAKFNPNTNPNYRPPVDSTPMNGQANNNVGKLTPPLPTKSNYADVKNPFDATYTGRLLAQAKDNAARQYQQRQSDIQTNMAQRGLTQAGTPGLQAQLENEARVAYDSGYEQLANQAQVQSAQLANGFDMQRAGALDAFDMNRGNLALGYSADARAGMLLPGQLTAQGLQNEAGSFQNKILSNDAYYYTSPEAANNRATRDNLQTALAGTQYEGASIGNAMRGMDFQTQQALLDTAIQQGRNQGTITAAEASAAQQLAAQGGAWWDSPWLKNFLRAALVGGGAVAGSLVPGVGTAAGAIAGGTAAGAIR